MEGHTEHCIASSACAALWPCVRQQPAFAVLRPLGGRDSAAALAPTEELEAALAAQQQEVKGRHALAKGRRGALSS